MKKIRTQNSQKSVKSNLSGDNGAEAEKARLREKDPHEWTVGDVGKWLDFIDMGQYKMVFIENSISGAELFELEPEDLASIQVRKLGHRKRILKRIGQLKKNSAAAFQALSDDSSESTSSSGSASSSQQSKKTTKSDTSDSKGGKKSRASGASAPDEVSYKCFYDDDVTVIKMRGKVSLNKLRRKMQQEFKSELEIKFKDDDGDLIPIKRLPHLKAAVKEAGGKPVRLYLADPDKHATIDLSKAEIVVLENLVDGCVIINKRGNIMFFNEAAEELFGYRKKQVLGKNVKLLMPSATADQHDNYIKSYLSKGEGEVMGKGRMVIGKKRDKTTFPLHLSISEAEIQFNDNGTCFVGIVKDASHITSTASKDPLDFSLLDGILDCAIVVDIKGTVEFFNKSAESLLGYSRSEVIGQNVKMLMPSPFREEHDGYLRNYSETGDRKVLGTGRDVVAQRKDGTVLQVHLSLSEQGLDTMRRFTGVLRPLAGKASTGKSVLQEEREVLDNLLVPAIVIDANATIHAFNQPASELLGYSLIEVVGKNVKMLMPAPDKNKHDSYIQNYLKTGKARVLGRGRDVVALQKDGSIDRKSVV